MIVGIPKESFPDERRVSVVPAGVGAMKKAGLQVRVEAAAGAAAGYPDQQYERAGAEVVADRNDVFQSDVLLLVRAAGANPDALPDDLPRFRPGQIVISMADPLGNPQAAGAVAERGVSLLALELLPRITRAQAMDVLSSMATVAGYRAVLLAATALGRMFPMLMTAAGTLAPARVFVVGAGVAGLQAIATARRLGAVVSAYDVRPAVRDQVQSLGAKFLEIELPVEQAEDRGGYAKQLDEQTLARQRELMAKAVADSDVVVTTAAVPGRRAPVLVTEEMVSQMRPGSVIVDLAAERGGNCQLTVAGKSIEKHGVTILGPVNLPSEVPYHASQMYSKNVTTFLLHLVKDGQVRLDLEDEIVRETLVAHGGQVVHARVREALGLPPAAGGVSSA